jgi:hypothetical protein
VDDRPLALTADGEKHLRPRLSRRVSLQTLIVIFGAIFAGILETGAIQTLFDCANSLAAT